MRFKTTEIIVKRGRINRRSWNAAIGAVQQNLSRFPARMPVSATGMLEKPTPSIFTVVFYGLKFFAAKLRNSA